MTVERPSADGMSIQTEEVALRNAMNTISRDAYAADCEIGVVRWNRAIKKTGIDFEIKLPHQRFRRNVGVWSGFNFAPEGSALTAEEWDARKDEWTPSTEDRAFIQSLMTPVTTPGKMAGWIAPPARGINNLGIEYEYVHL